MNRSTERGAGMAQVMPAAANKIMNYMKIKAAAAKFAGCPVDQVIEVGQQSGTTYANGETECDYYFECGESRQHVVVEDSPLRRKPFAHKSDGIVW